MFLTTTVVMAACSEEKVNFDITKSAGKDNQSDPTPTSNTPDGFRSRFSWIGQSLNEKGKQVTEGFAKVLSRSNSPTSVLGRLFTSPAPVRRAKSNGRRDNYLRQSKSASSSPSTSTPWNISHTEYCSSNKQHMDITGTNQHRKLAKSRSEVMTDGVQRLGTAKQKYGADKVGKQGNTYGKIGISPVAFGGTQDCSVASDDTDSESDFDDTEAGHNRMRSRAATSCSTYKYSVEENAPKANLSLKDLQHSVLYGEAKGRRHSYHSTSRYQVAVPHGDDGARDARVNDNRDPFKMISLIMSPELSANRDSYRTTRRPSQKQTKQRNSVCRSLSHGDRVLLNRYESVDRQTQDYKDNDEPKLKLSVQTFASSQQMRVIVMEVVNVDKLCEWKSKAEQHIQLCLKLGKTHHKIGRQVKSFDGDKLWEDFHFFDIDVEEISSAELRIRLYSKHRYVSIHGSS